MKKSVFSLLMIITMIFSLMSVPAFAEDPEEPEHLYLTFASDLHGKYEALNTALAGFPSEMDYVSLIGDQVGEGGDYSPAYKSSEIYQKVAEHRFDDLESNHISLVWADHDEEVEDDAHIVVCSGGYNSGQAARCLYR